MNPYFSKVFVAGPGAPEEVLQTIALCGDERLDGRTVLRQGIVIEARRNELARAAEAVGKHDAFLSYPLVVEIEGNEETNDAAYVVVVSDVMKRLAGAGFRVVAASVFENLLPGRGSLPE